MYANLGFFIFKLRISAKEKTVIYRIITCILFISKIYVKEALVNKTAKRLL